MNSGYFQLAFSMGQWYFQSLIAKSSPLENCKKYEKYQPKGKIVQWFKSESRNLLEKVIFYLKPWFSFWREEYMWLIFLEGVFYFVLQIKDELIKPRSQGFYWKGYDEAIPN